MPEVQKEKKNDCEIHWYSAEIAEALKQHDLSSVWISDSSATTHMTGHKNWLLEIKPIKAVVKVGDDKVIQAEGVGEILLIAKDDSGKPCNITLQNVLYVPELKANLFSIPRTVVHGKGTIIYHKKIIHIKSHGTESKTVAVGY